MKVSKLYIQTVSLVFVFFLSSCEQKKFNTKEELLAFIAKPENNYTQNKSVAGYDFTITYKPTDLLVQQELVDNTNIDSLRAKYSKYLYFNVTISKNSQEILNGLAGDRNKFGAMVNQLAFGMGDKVNLISKSKDTIPLADYIYPRLYGMGGGTSMLFVYPKDAKALDQEYLYFTIEDIGLRIGEIGFKIPTKIIKQQPKLAFNI